MNTPLSWLLDADMGSEMRPSWILDTNAVSEMMRPFPEPRAAAFLDGVAGEGICLSSITAWEILNGIGRLAPGGRRKDLAERFERLLDDLFDDRIVDWTLADAQICAGLMEEKRRRGEPLDDHLPDAMIAGTAIRWRLAIVTRNTREFSNTGIEVVNPWTDPQPSR